MTLDPGYGLAASGFGGVPPSPVGGELTLTGTPPVAALPGIATQRFLAATNASVGSVVQADVNGAVVSVRIVGAVTHVPDRDRQRRRADRGPRPPAGRADQQLAVRRPAGPVVAGDRWTGGPGGTGRAGR